MLLQCNRTLGSPEESINESITSFTLNQILKILREVGVPYGSRTRVAAVKGRCPRPLDERDALGEVRGSAASRLSYRTSLLLSNA